MHMAKRPRGSVRTRRHPDGETRFEELVGKAIDAIPEPFARALDDVAIVIADEPTSAQRRESHLGPNDDLYGLYEGVPRTEYAADYAFWPNKITLFQRALEQDFSEPAELERQVRVTVMHELAHHLGIGDARLHDLGVE
jgi:predicted Zn-dependent protease with MMP-like domain